MHASRKPGIVFAALLLALAIGMRAASSAAAPPAAASAASAASAIAAASSVAAAPLAAPLPAPATIGAPSDADGLVSFGHDSRLAAGARGNGVVSIFGSSIDDGHAQSVVSIFGNTRVTGSASDDAVAVFGNTYVDGKTRGDVVAVFGSVELGPHADVGGDVVAVGGAIKRDPSAVVHGETQDVRIGMLANFQWLHPWIEHGLLYGRPLAFAPGLAWAWWLALGFLALYVLLAACFRDGLMHCVATVESRPGQTVVASLLALLAIPVLIVLLCVTVIGVAAVPFVLLGVFCADLFGKAVVLAWLGRLVSARRATGVLAQPTILVLLGGVIVLALYLVPVLGLLAQKAFSVLGLGAVFFTLILEVRARQAAAGSASPDAAAAGGGAAPTAPPPEAATAAAAVAAGASANLATAALPRAGFWIRMVALLVDAILVGIVTAMLVGRAHTELLFLAAYGAIMWKLRGSTVGGSIFHLRVMRTDGQAIGWETAIVRALACFLSLAVAGLGFIWVAIDQDKQAWHDKIAGTIVVRTRPAPSLV